MPPSTVCPYGHALNGTPATSLQQTWACTHGLPVHRPAPYNLQTLTNLMDILSLNETAIPTLDQPLCKQQCWDGVGTILWDCINRMGQQHTLLTMMKLITKPWHRLYVVYWGWLWHLNNKLPWTMPATLTAPYRTFFSN